MQQQSLGLKQLKKKPHLLCGKTPVDSQASWSNSFLISTSQRARGIVDRVKERRSIGEGEWEEKKMHKP
jgi:hypothetical protein